MLSQKTRIYSLLLIAAMVVVAASWVTLRQVERQVASGAVAALQTVLHTALEALVNWSTGHVNTTANWAEQDAIRNAAIELIQIAGHPVALVQHPRQQVLRQDLAAVLATSGFKGFFIVSLDGINVASSRDDNIGVPSLLFNQVGFLDRILTGQAAATAPLPSDVPLPDLDGNLVEQAPTMFAGAPIKDEAGEIIAIFTFRLDPDVGVFHVLQDSGFGSTGETYAVDRRGRMISASLFEDQLRGMGLLATNQSSTFNVRAEVPKINEEDRGRGARLTVAAQHVTLGETGVSSQPYDDYRGIPVFGAWVWDENLEMGIISEIDVSEALAPYHTTRLLVIILVSFVLIMLAYTTVRFERRLGVTKIALDSSEAHLRAIVSSALDAIISIDQQGMIQSFNPAAEEIFGYSYLEVLGKSVNILMPESYSKGHDQSILNYMDGKAPKIIGIGREVIGLRKDNSQFQMWLGVNEVWVGGSRMFVGVVRDITEQKAAQAELQQHRDHLEDMLGERTKELSEAVEALETEVTERRKAENDAHLANRAKSEFLANMSHELRTPLNAILGFSEIIEKKIFGDRALGRYTDYATDIRESGEHLLDIINDILDLAKVEAGEMEVDESIIDPEILVEACMRLIREKAEAAGLTITASHDHPPLKIFADERKMKQMLINLLANGIKFTEHGGAINIATNLRSDGRFQLEVIDTGVGIAPEDIPKVLTPFGQADATLTRDATGTGLGLPLVRSLVELHGGEMELESIVGKGTTLRIILPEGRVSTHARAGSITAV